MSGEDRRRSVLDAAARLFRHYGHAKTTMADIAREAGVAVGTLYLEFSSKEAIFEELSRATHLDVLARMEAASAQPGNITSRLVAVARARTAGFFELVAQGQHACELVHCKAEGARAANARFREDERAFLARLLAAAAAAGEIRSVDADRTAALVQRAYVSLSPPWVFEAEAEAAARAAADMAELLLLGLVPRREAGE